VKVAVINDTHFGIRNDSELFLNYFVDFFRDQFFPYLQENNIDTVLHLGDFFDRRKYVNFNTLNRVTNEILIPMKNMGINIHCLVGNHDTYFKNTNRVNSVCQLLSQYDNIKTYGEFDVINIGGTDIAMVPWINDSNEKDIVKQLKKCKAAIACGHFELTGYEVLRGVKFDGGMSDEVLNKFELVLSGHFHLKSSHKNICYLGTQYQMLFSDINEAKGFHVFDLETRELDYIQNRNCIFHRIFYDDSATPKIDKMDFSQYENKLVKIIVQRKTNPATYEKFIDGINSANAHEISIVDETFVPDDSTEVADLSVDTLSFIEKEIDQLIDVKNKDELKKMIHDIYFESLDND
jgi:DNA repair exonuclease SbcCD nuclease subunit